MNKKRFWMYIGISFGLTWGLGAAAYAMGVRYEDMAMQFVLILSMFAPLAAMLLTRLRTREGFRGMEPAIGFAGKRKYYVLAVFIPVLYIEAGWGLLWLRHPEAFSAKQMTVVLPAACLVSALIYSAAAFGEEAGWRGYMYPKLAEKFGDVGACLIGGTAWAVWHFPMIAQGHTFGLDYPGAPYLGFLVFIPYCIGVGSIQWYLTKKSGSVWPAAFLHAVNNAYISGSFLMTAAKDAGGVLDNGNRLAEMTVLMLPSMLVGVVCMIEMRKKKES